MTTTVFICFLLFFAVGYLTVPFQGVNYTEQRNYAKRPELSAKAVLDGSYSKDFESYLKDHILMRSELVTLRSELGNIFGRPFSSLVFRGKDGQLFLRPTLDEPAMLMTAEMYRSFAEKQNVPVDMILCPDAGAVLTDKLPWAAVIEDEDRIAAKFTEALGSRINLFNAKQTIAELRDSGMKVFFKTDQHWTAECARNVLDRYFEQSGQEIPEITYNEKQTAPFFGNLYSGAPGFFDEMETVKYLENPDGVYHLKELDTGTESDSVFDTMWNLGVRNRYNIFIGGHFDNTHITSNANGGKLLLMGDSYLMPLVPLLADRFSEIRIIDLRQFAEKGKSLSQLLGDFEPDRVLIVNTVYQISNGAVSLIG